MDSRLALEKLKKFSSMNLERITTYVSLMYEWIWLVQSQLSKTTTGGQFMIGYNKFKQGYTQRLVFVETDYEQNY